MQTLNILRIKNPLISTTLLSFRNNIRFNSGLDTKCTRIFQTASTSSSVNGRSSFLKRLLRFFSRNSFKEPIRQSSSNVFPLSIPVGVKRFHKPVGWWMLLCGGMCAGAVILGGATRLTESGLSIVHWRFLGEKRPHTYAEWIEEFEKYKAFPEFHFKSFSDGEMSLSEFKRIYWLEYLHRQWGRMLGAVFLLPAIGFWVAGSFARPMQKRIAVLASLICFQGLLGWYMVKSGLKKPPSITASVSEISGAGGTPAAIKSDEPATWKHPPRVSSYRLAAHLSTAFLLFAGFSWTACSILFPPVKFDGIKEAADGKRVIRGLRNLLHVSRLMKLIVFTTVVSGALVAGLDAGMFYNTWPTMSGYWWKPPDYQSDAAFPSNAPVSGDKASMPASGKQKGWLRNAFENPAAAQFHHRLLGESTPLIAMAMWFYARRRFGFAPATSRLPPRVRIAVHILFAFSLLQPTLGILTLMNAVPVSLGIMHQAGALGLFSSALWLAHTLRFLPK